MHIYLFEYTDYRVITLSLLGGANSRFAQIWWGPLESFMCKTCIVLRTSPRSTPTPLMRADPFVQFEYTQRSHVVGDAARDPGRLGQQPTSSGGGGGQAAAAASAAGMAHGR